jgi:hypothetical protein
MPNDLLHVSTVPLGPGKRLSKQQYAEVEQFLKDWKKEVLDAVKKHPKRSYALGRAQSEAFLKLLGQLNTVPGPATLGPGPTTTAAVDWLQTYTLHELDTSLETYVSRIKDALLYGLHGVVNPVQVAAWLQKATHDAGINWRTIARTEMVRANAAGRLAVCREQGYDRVYAPPHVGACKKCKRLLENKVFRIDEVEGITNFGRDPTRLGRLYPCSTRTAAIAWLPYIPEVYDELVSGSTNAFQEAGLTDDKVLDEMFDSGGGQLKPEFTDDPRLAAFKVGEPFAHAMAHVITKVREDFSPVRPHPDEALAQRGGHGNGRTRANARRAGDCCRSGQKGFFDNPQARSRPAAVGAPQAPAAPRSARTSSAGGARRSATTLALWSHVYLMGGATSPQWDSVPPARARPRR